MSNSVSLQTDCLSNEKTEIEFKTFAPDTLGPNRFWHVYIDVYADGDFGFDDFAGVGSSDVNLYFEKLSAVKEFIENYLKEIIATFHSTKHESLKDSFIDALDEFYNGNEWYSFDEQMVYACYKLDKDMGNQNFVITVMPCEYVIGDGFIQYRDLDPNEISKA